MTDKLGFYRQGFWSQLQGLRCIACLLVIADHCNLLGMGGHGGVAVCFFLTLSGFLLVKPRITDGEESFVSVRGILRFFKGKVIRLLPSYYLLVILHAFLSGQYSYLPGDLFFFSASGHLWYIQQYVVMLLIFPVLMIVIWFLKRKLRLNNFVIAVLLLAAAYLCRRYITADVFYLMGNGRRQRFRIGLFIVGMSAGYFYKGALGVFAASFAGIEKSGKGARLVLDLVGAAVIAAAVLSGGRLLGMILPQYAGYEIAYAKDFECAIASAVLILAVVLNPDGLLGKLLSLDIMVLIGELSYDIYLIHPMLLSFVIASTASRLFLRVLLLSFCAAYSMKAVREMIRGR